MQIRIRETGEIQTQDQFERALRASNVSVPEGGLNAEGLDDHGVDPVFEGPQPTGEPWQHVEPDGIEQVAGQWRTKWKLAPEVLDADGLTAQKALKLAALADRRWRCETGGITFAQMPLKTDEDTQRKITGAYVQADKNPAFTARWKMGAGLFVTLDAATIIAIGDAVTTHIQACFDNEGSLSDQIMAAEDYAALAAIDIEAGWPT